MVRSSTDSSSLPPRILRAITSHAEPKPMTAARVVRRWSSSRRAFLALARALGHRVEHAKIPAQWSAVHRRCASLSSAKARSGPGSVRLVGISLARARARLLCALARATVRVECASVRPTPLRVWRAQLAHALPRFILVRIANAVARHARVLFRRREEACHSAGAIPTALHAAQRAPSGC